MPVKAPNKIIDVKAAVKIAFECVSNMFKKDEVRDLRLEEVEISDKEDYWYITLSFPERSKKYDPLGILGQSARLENRELKKVTINAETGKVKSVTVRKLNVD